MNRLLILIELAKRGAHLESRQISSGELGNRLGCSQQTAARWLTKLSEEGLIERNAGAQGQIIKLTSGGVEKVKSVWQDLNEIFGGFPEKFKLTGELVSGLGEGSYYVSQEKYQDQFKEKLGFEPYPGTLDIDLDEESLTFKKRLQDFSGIKIEGFSSEERNFGGGKCFPAKIKGEKAAVVLPDRTHHEENIVDVISPVKIRDKYNLKDGDEVEVEVEI